MVYMKVFTKRRHYALLYGPPAGATYRYAHLIVTFQAVEVLFNLTGVRSELDATVAAVEMVGMIWLTLNEDKVRLMLGKFALGHHGEADAR